MAIVEKEFNLDIVPGYSPPTIHVSEYDIGRKYYVSLLNDGEIFTIPSGATASIEGTIEDYIFYTSKNVKGIFRSNAAISNNKVVFDLTEEMTAFSGRVWCKIKLILGESPISTCGFILEVDRAGANAESISKVSGFTEQLASATGMWISENEPALISEPVINYLNSQDPQTVVVSAILLAVYPVGSYYWSDEPTDPATLFGGTWSKVRGVFLFAEDDNHDAGSLGGEETHQLTIVEMPEHAHNIWTSAEKTDGGSLHAPQETNTDSPSYHEWWTQSTGASTPHNNMPPYRAAYCWRRIA